MKNTKSCGVVPSENKKSCGGVPSNKKNWLALSHFFTVKKGFNMLKKAFFAFERLNKPMFLMIRAGWSLPKTKNPSGVPSEKKIGAQSIFHC